MPKHDGEESSESDMESEQEEEEEEDELPSEMRSDEDELESEPPSFENLVFKQFDEPSRTLSPPGSELDMLSDDDGGGNRETEMK